MYIKEEQRRESREGDEESERNGIECEDVYTILEFLFQIGGEEAIQDFLSFPQVDIFVKLLCHNFQVQGSFISVVNFKATSGSIFNPDTYYQTISMINSFVQSMFVTSNSQIVMKLLEHGIVEKWIEVFINMLQ